MLVSFEKMEALRWLEYLKAGGKVIVNDYEIPPMPVLSGTVQYPKDILEELCQRADTLVINAAEQAAEIGSARAMNMVLLGAAVRLLELDDIDWLAIVKNNVKAQFEKMNVEAFLKGSMIAEQK